MSSWGLLRKAEGEGSSPGFAQEIFGEGSMISLALVCKGYSESDAMLAVYVGRKLRLVHGSSPVSTWGELPRTLCRQRELVTMVGRGRGVGLATATKPESLRQVK